MLPLVMPCYASLQDALQEVIFVDDGSVDGSKELAHEIATQFRHLPIVWIDHEMERWDEQRNIGLDAATGDFILSIDADMGFTGNLLHLLESGYFNRADVWDFHLLYCRGDRYHYDVASGYRWNWTTRLIKNCGVRYQGAAHEQPDRYGGVSKTNIPSVKAGILPVKGRCEDVLLFEWSYLSPDDKLLERGYRLDRWREFMTARGISPRGPNAYYAFAHSNAETEKLPDQVCTMIPTMNDALKHWGKHSVGPTHVYGQKYHQGNRDAHRGKRADKVAQAIVDVFGPRSAIEFGCSAAYFLESLANMNVDVYGIDGDETAFADGVRCIPRECLEVYDLRLPYFPTKKYDVCMSLETLEHIEPEYTDTVIDSMCRCSDNLFMTIATPGQSGIHHVNMRSPAEWQKMFERRSFVRVTELPDYMASWHTSLVMTRDETIRVL